MPYQVLIVDDNPSIRRLLRSWIEQYADLNVCGEAENGRVAVQKAKELQPHIVILDFQMPVMNGLDAAMLLKIVVPDALLLVLTLHTSPQLRREAEGAGIAEVFSKTETFKELLGTLKKFGVSFN